MRLLHRLGFALWLGLLALTVSGTAQTQLSLSVINAALTEPHAAGGHYMPDGTWMAGSMHGGTHEHGPDAQGHTHKGHADCSLCGLIASMAAIAAPALDVVIVPDVFTVPPAVAAPQAFRATAGYSPYISRAPPHPIG